MPATGSDTARELSRKVREYWNDNVHDIKISSHPVGSKEFFEDLKEYHFDKLDYLLPIVHSPEYRGKKVIELGCSVGTDLMEFAATGAEVTGVDFSETSVGFARKNFELNGLKADLRVMDAEDLDFDDESFDVVYAHGLIQYTASPEQAAREMHRVLKPGGEAIVTVYNKRSWLNLLSKVLKVELEHEDAPIKRLYTTGQVRRLLKDFSSVRITLERFPVKTRLHHGLKAVLYNGFFVNVFNVIPRPLVRPFGWHIVARARK